MLFVFIEKTKQEFGIVMVVVDTRGFRQSTVSRVARPTVHGRMSIGKGIFGSRSRREDSVVVTMGLRSGWTRGKGDAGHGPETGRKM